jgi:hypothetical protein
VKRAPRVRSIPVFDRPFNGFDGEGEGNRFTLLADGSGRALYHADRRRLTTIECLEFLLDSPKQRNNVWFSFGYDVTNILYDLSRERLRKLREDGFLYLKTKTGKYRIAYIPTKTFSVSHRTNDCRCAKTIGRKSTKCAHYRSFTSADVFGFFQKSFLATMPDWCKSLPDDVTRIIEEGKTARGEFETWPMEKIIAYNAAELVILEQIMTNFREALREAGWKVKAWSGAGNLAQYWLDREKADSYFGAMTPGNGYGSPEMLRAVNCAMAGARIDSGVQGYGKAGEGDIISAYPAQYAQLPDLTDVTFSLQKTKKLPPPYSIVHVRWDVPSDTRWGPFFFREVDNTIKWPLDGEGWYHQVEVAAALKRFPKGITILEAMVPNKISGTPFHDAIYRDFAKRAEFKAMGHPANVPIKLGLNSLYGKMAQRAGIKRDKRTGEIRYPRFHNLYYAGLITAGTRARCQDAIRVHGDANVLAVATDAVFVKKAFVIIEPSALGAWEVDGMKSMVLAGAGMYETFDADGKSLKLKQRGFGKDKIDYREVLRAWDRGKSVQVPVRRFVTMGQAQASDEAYAKRGMFLDSVREMRSPSVNPYATKRFRPYIPKRENGWLILEPGIRNGEVSEEYQVHRIIDLRNDDNDQEV